MLSKLSVLFVSCCFLFVAGFTVGQKQGDFSRSRLPASVTAMDLNLIQANLHLLRDAYGYNQDGIGVPWVYFDQNTGNIGAGLVTITPTGGSSIDGAASVALATDTGMEIYNNGLNFQTQKGAGGGGGDSPPGGVTSDVQVNCSWAFCDGDITNDLVSHAVTVGNVGNVSLKPDTGTVQYVSFNGNDSNDGLSWGTAKQSIWAALQGLAFG